MPMIFNYQFTNQELLAEALAHPSYLNEQRSAGYANYQRLEFLGDAVLGMLLADMLFQHFPDSDEGELSRLRATLVDQECLARLAVAAGLPALVLLGKGAEREGGRENPSILADVFEAVIGALYREAGFGQVRAVVEQIYAPLLAERARYGFRAADAKSELQELLASRKQPPPEYRLSEDLGPAHARQFKVVVMVADQPLAEGAGRSKRAAQQAAAQAALQQLRSLG